MTQAQQIQATEIAFKDLFASAIEWQLTPNEFRVYCQILHQAIPQRVGGLATVTVLTLSTRTKIQLIDVQTAVESLVNSKLIIRIELPAIKRISYRLIAPNEWLVSNSSPVAPTEIKTDKYFGGGNSKDSNFTFSEETPWLNPPRSRKDINFKPEFILFHASRLQASKPGTSLFDAKEIIKGYFLKNPDAIILKWDSYQEWLAEEETKAQKERAVFNPMKLSLGEHEELIAQRIAFGDKQFEEMGEIQKNYLDWTRQKPSEYGYIVKQIKSGGGLKNE